MPTTPSDLTSTTAGDHSIRGWLLHAAPLLVVALVPIVDLPLPPVTDRPELAVAAIVATFALLGTWLLLWRTTQLAGSRSEAWLALAYLPIVALWRHAEGGSQSGYGPLVLGPLVFVALHGRRIDVLACVSGILAIFLGPVLVDEAAYPAASEVRRAGVWLVAGLVSGLAIQRLVQLTAQAKRTTQLVLERLPGTVIIVFDREMRYLSVHGQGSGSDDGLPWDSLVGATPAELFGRRASAFEQQLQLTIGGTPREFEWSSTSGKRRHLVCTSPWTSTGPGDQAAGVMVIRDITEHARLTQELDRERAFLHAVVDNMQDGVAALGVKGGFQLFSDSFRSLLGIDQRPDVPPDQWIGGVFDAFDEQGAPLDASASPIMRALDGEDVPCEQITVRLPDGARRDLEVTASPIRVYGDAILGAVMTLHDVTAQREAERMKEQFFALVSHELRTPLAAIVGYLELLDEEERDNMSDDGREFVTVMQRNSQRLMRLIGDLLFAAQVDAGTLTLVTSRIDVGAVVRDAYDTARVRAGERGQELELTVDAPEHGLEYDGDRDRLGQVVDNLLTNALKFTPPGGRIELRVCERDEAIVIEVQDTGPGIAEDDQQRLFERFARARSAEEGAVQGVGLGLAITKAIVDAHGGSITLDSTVGVGSTFGIRLPLADATPGGVIPSQRVRV